jgi:hypothetical protein
MANSLIFWNIDTVDIQEGKATFQVKGECQDFSVSIVWNSSCIPIRHSTAINRTQRLPVPVVTSLEQVGGTGDTQW